VIVNFPMKIAQVAPLYESVPPRLYGGTERVVSFLTEELVRQGHEVTLYASGDSLTRAQLRPGCESALRLQDSGRSERVDPLASHMLLLEQVAQEADEFDIIHFHLDYLPFSLIRRSGIPAVSTFHNRLDVSSFVPLFREFTDMNLVSVSDAQRAPVPWAGWLETIYHGLPEDLLNPTEEPENYLAFLGRISPQKRVERAVEIAGRAGMRLRIAAKIEPADLDYFEQVRHLFDEQHVEFLGEIGEHQKNDFLGRARALLFPIDWPEPFGLVMIEALACGTPVIAFRRGSVEEVIEDGVTGFVVDSVDEAVKAVGSLETIDRTACRGAFEERFSARRMCRDYVRAYQRVIRGRVGATARSNGPISLAG
jgi:glycosyltransferase involved in cell wall biosynthesis